MRSISVLEAIDEYRTYNRAQNYSPPYVASADRNLRQFARWPAREGRSQDLSRLTIEAAGSLSARRVLSVLLPAGIALTST